MKLKMYEVFRKRCEDKTYYEWLIIALCLVIFFTYKVITDENIAILGFLFGPVKIEAGEDLAKYDRYRVTCEVPYVFSEQKDFWVTEEDTNILRTYSYVGLDKNLENPFVFHVNLESEDVIAEEMVRKTKRIYYGEDMKKSIGTLRVEGYVRPMDDQYTSYYMEGLNAFYKEERYKDDEDFEAYAIYKSNNAFWGICEFAMLIKVFFWIASIIFAYIPLKIILDIYNNTKLKKYMQMNKVDENFLNQDFLSAWEFSDNYWIGDEYTYYVYNKNLSLFLNKDIVWAFTENTKRNGKTCLVFYTLSRRKHTIYVNTDMVEDILSYYEKKYSRILIGSNNKEMHRLFKENYNVFLDIHYRKN